MSHSIVSSTVNSTSGSRESFDSKQSTLASNQSKTRSVLSTPRKRRSANAPAVHSATNYPFFPADLVTRMSQDLHLTGKAERPHSGYLRAVRKLSEFCRTCPDKITEDQVRHYFLHLKNDLEYAYGSLRSGGWRHRFVSRHGLCPSWQEKISLDPSHESHCGIAFSI